MTQRPKFLPPVDGFDDQTDEENALADAYSGGLPSADLSDIGPSAPQDDATAPAVGGGMKVLDDSDKADLDQAIGSKLASQPPPPPPGSQMPAQGAPGRPPSMPAPMAPGYDDDQADEEKISQAADRDRMNRMLRGLETASKQLTAGVLQQPVAETVGQDSNYEGAARAEASKGKDRRHAAGIDARNFAATTEQRRIAAAHQKYLESKAEKDAADKVERYKKTDAEHDEDQDIRREQNKAMLSMSGAQLSIAQEGAGIRRDEHDTKKEDAAKKDSARTFDYDGGQFVIKDGLSNGEDGKAREIGGQYNAAFNALDGLKPKLAAIVSAKSAKELADARSELAGSVQAAATASNAALGQGAMADNEKRAMFDAMGADIFSLDGARAFASGDPATINRRLAAFRGIVTASARGRLAPYGAIQGRQESAPTQGKVYQNAKGEKIRWDGKAWAPIK
jgi:hypothetical protein